MGSYQDFRKYIESRLGDNWNVSGVDIVYDNMQYTPNPQSSYIYLTIVENSSRQITYNASNTACHRYSGFISVHINVPLYTGTNTARGYADAIADIFTNAQFSDLDIVTKTSQISRVGEVNGMFQYVVVTPFYVDIVRSNAT